MRVIVAGSRGITDEAVVLRALRHAWLFEAINPTTIVSGTARGVDQLGERIAAKNKLRVAHFRAAWDLYGKAAGHMRNAQMAGNADALVAVWDGKSPGTRNMIQEAKKKNLLVWVEIIPPQTPQ